LAPRKQDVQNIAVPESSNEDLLDRLMEQQLPRISRQEKTTMADGNNQQSPPQQERVSSRVGPPPKYQYQLEEHQE